MKLDIGIMSAMVLLEEDDGESQLLRFGHGEGCDCGSTIGLYREQWEEMGSPRAINVAIFGLPTETVIERVEGPWGQL